MKSIKKIKMSESLVEFCKKYDGKYFWIKDKTKITFENEKIKYWVQDGYESHAEISETDYKTFNSIQKLVEFFVMWDWYNDEEEEEWIKEKIKEYGNAANAWIKSDQCKRIQDNKFIVGKRVKCKGYNTYLGVERKDQIGTIVIVNEDFFGVRFDNDIDESFVAYGVTGYDPNQSNYKIFELIE